MLSTSSTPFVYAVLFACLVFGATTGFWCSSGTGFTGVLVTVWFRCLSSYSKCQISPSAGEGVTTTTPLPLPIPLPTPSHLLPSLHPRQIWAAQITDLAATNAKTSFLWQQPRGSSPVPVYGRREYDCLFSVLTFWLSPPPMSHSPYMRKHCPPYSWCTSEVGGGERSDLRASGKTLGTPSQNYMERHQAHVSGAWINVLGTAEGINLDHQIPYADILRWGGRTKGGD